MHLAEPDFTDASWAKSSYSGSDKASCVEVAAVFEWVGVRDTKQRGAGPILSFAHAQWAAFLAKLPR